MSIVRQTKLFYFVGSTPYASLEEAQKADLMPLIPDVVAEQTHGGSGTDLHLLPGHKRTIADWLLKNADAVATILRTTPRSRIRKPRKDKGVPRKKANEAAVNSELQDMKQ